MGELQPEHVTLAILQRDILHLTALLEHHIASQSRLTDDHEVRLRHLESNLGARVGRIEEAQKSIIVGQSIFTTVAAALAAWFGSK